MEEWVNTPPWVFFTFFKLYKCYLIVQRTTYSQVRYFSASKYYVQKQLFKKSAMKKV